MANDDPITEDGGRYEKHLYLPDGRYRRCGNCIKFAECRVKHDKTFVYSERGGCMHHVGNSITKQQGKTK